MSLAFLHRGLDLARSRVLAGLDLLTMVALERLEFRPMISLTAAPARIIQPELRRSRCRPALPPSH